MKIYRSTKALQKDSILVQDGTIAVSPEGEEVIDTSWTEGYKWHYSVLNGVVAFVNNTGELYVTPVTQGKLMFLEGRFAQGDFPVPLSNGAYPKGQKSLWRRLLKEALRDAYTW